MGSLFGVSIQLSCFFLILGSSSSVLASPVENSSDKGPLKFILGQENLGEWRNEILEATVAPGPADAGPRNELVLAAKRTDRPDFLHGFKHYRGDPPPDFLHGFELKPQATTQSSSGVVKSSFTSSASSKPKPTTPKLTTEH